MTPRSLARAGTLVLALAVTLASAAVADEREFPHLHYTGTALQADGTPVPAPVFFSPGSLRQFGPGLAPASCYDGSPGKSSATSSGGRWAIQVAVRDTPECVAAMQTFTPPAAAFPDVTAAGWVFRRQ